MEVVLLKRIIAIIVLVLVTIALMIMLPINWEAKGIIVQTMLILCIVGITALVYSFVTHAKDDKIKWLEDRLEVWNNISYHVKRAGDEAFNELPVGIVIYDDDYEIKWANRYAKSIFQNKLVERPLNAISADLFAQVKEEKETINVSVYDKKYDVISRKEHRLLYFFDVTKREEITQKYKDRTTAIGIIYLDNIEESLSSFDVQERSEMRGRYLGEISDWISKFGGYLKSYDNDRLVIVLDYKQLQEMISERFEILNKVRDISNEYELRVTASIGIACWDVGYEELGGLAQNAIELAEKRGGDQVVVNIQNEKIQYFGGKTNALEKSSKVLVRVMTQTLRDLIEESSDVVILGHINTDVDAFGAMVGVSKMVLTSGVPVKIVMDDTKVDLTVKKILDMVKKEHITLMSYITSEQDALNSIKDSTLLIVVDTQSPQIISSKEILEKANKKAIIDHHRRGEVSFDDAVFSYIEPYASSSVELVTEMFSFYGKKVQISSFEATLMMAGMVVDTNDFTFRTGSRTFDVASTLREYGADTIRVKTMLRDDLSRRLTITSLANKVEILYGKYAIVKAIEEEILDRVMLAQISEELLQIDNVDAAFTIGVVDNGLVGISARSYQDVNVQIIMEELGGGGHLNGAATQLENTTVEDAYKMLIDVLEKEHLQEGEEKMKIILLEDVKGRGNKNDIIDVANGYANFLINAGKATPATADNIKKVKEEQERALEEAENHLKLMQKLKGEIDNKTVNVYIKIGGDGKMFGSITTKQICDEFENQFGIRLDKRKITLTSEINSLGIYEAEVELCKDVVAKIQVHVLEK